MYRSGTSAIHSQQRSFSLAVAQLILWFVSQQILGQVQGTAKVREGNNQILSGGITCLSFKIAAEERKCSSKPYGELSRFHLLIPYFIHLLIINILHCERHIQVLTYFLTQMILKYVLSCYHARQLTWILQKQVKE